VFVAFRTELETNRTRFPSLSPGSSPVPSAAPQPGARLARPLSHRRSEHSARASSFRTCRSVKGRTPPSGEGRSHRVPASRATQVRGSEGRHYRDRTKGGLWRSQLAHRPEAAEVCARRRRALRSGCGHSAGRALAHSPMEASLPDAHRRRDVADPVGDRRQRCRDGLVTLGARSRLRRRTRPENPRAEPCGARSRWRVSMRGTSGKGHSWTCRFRARAGTSVRRQS
jgi:hypothetical protein